MSAHLVVVHIFLVGLDGRHSSLTFLHATVNNHAITLRYVLHTANQPA